MENRTTIVIGAVLLTLLIGGAAIAMSSSSSNQATMTCDDAADAIYVFPVNNIMKIATAEALSDAELEIMIDNLEFAKAYAADASNALAQLMPVSCGYEVCKFCGNIIHKDSSIYGYKKGNVVSMEKNRRTMPLAEHDVHVLKYIDESSQPRFRMLFTGSVGPCPMCGAYGTAFER